MADDHRRIDTEHGRAAHVLVIHRIPESVSAAEFLVDVVEALGHLQHRVAHETVADDHVCDLAREEVRCLDVTHEIDAVVGLQQLVRGLGLRIALGLLLADVEHGYTGFSDPEHGFGINRAYQPVLRQHLGFAVYVQSHVQQQRGMPRHRRNDG